MITVEYLEAPTPGEMRTAVRIVGVLVWLERIWWAVVGAGAYAVCRTLIA